jgi:hypothetical protein
VVCRIGSDYDIALAWMLGRNMLWPEKRTPRERASSAARTTTAFICSTLLAQAFALVGHTIEAPPAPGNPGGHVTPADFERAPLFSVAWSATSTPD